MNQRAEEMNQLIEYSIPAAKIAKMRMEYMTLKIGGVADADGAKVVHAARMDVKNHRVAVEKRRKELKADALEWGRKVDDEAKRITAELEPIESYLEQQEKAHEAEVFAVKNAVRLKAEAEERARQEAEAARLKAEHDAEVARLAAQKAEQDRIAAEQKAAQDKIDAENRKLEAEKRRLADLERERLHAVEVEKAKAEAAERARKETEARIERERQEAERKKAEAEAARVRAESLRPDREKLLGVADAICAVIVPSVSAAARQAAADVREILRAAISDIRKTVEEMK